MAMSFGGVALPQFSDEMLGFVAQFCKLEDLKIFEYPTWPGLRHAHLPWKPYEVPEIDFGRLYWPTGASRFAVGYFLVTDHELAELQTTAWTSAGPQPLPFVMDDETAPTVLSTTTPADTGRIQTNLYALPPIPIQRIYPSVSAGTDPLYTDVINDALASQNKGTGSSAGVPVPEQEEPGVYLLVLVDERYFWWHKNINSQNSSNWSDWFDEIADVLGKTFTISAIDSAYNSLSPSWRFLPNRTPLPILLDAGLNQVGLRLVRKLDGTILLQNAATAYQAQLNERNKFSQMTGGRVNQETLKKSVPASVTVIFDRAFYPLHRSPYTITVSLTDLELGSYEDVSGMTGYTKPLVADTPAQMRDASQPPANQSDLQKVAMQMAKDWYLWQLSDADVHYAGIVPWTPNGLNDYVVWSYIPFGAPLAGTKITRCEQWAVMVPSERETRTESVVVEITGARRSDGLYPAKVLSLDPQNTRAWPIEDCLVWEASDLTGVITSFMIGEGAVGTYQIEDGSILSVDIADGEALTPGDILDGGTW